MKVNLPTLLIIACSIVLSNCNAPKQGTFQPRVVYTSDELIITRISENAFEHTSYKQTTDFGNVPCNGLIVRNGHETIVFDTPTNDTASAALIQWITDSLHCRINAILPTHFHDDCLGGLTAFHEKGVPSYAYFKTIQLATENKSAVPQNSFRDALVLKVGRETIIARFFGEGHTKDNVVAYFPSENILFGGCLIKEKDAGKGYLGDANITEWSNTVERVKKEYPDVRLVIPGHGAYGNKELLDYTISLFTPGASISSTPERK